MAKKMDERDLLSILQEQEDSAAHFVFGTLAAERRESLREYYRQPYGNEEEGWSSIVTSEVQDTVEWILPSLLDMFLSNEEAVVFEPTKAEDEKSAQQATDAANYVFHKQNNGFMTLYTAFKDALMVKNCAVHWRKETVRTVEKIPVRGATNEMLAAIMEDGDELEAARETLMPMQDPLTGAPVFDESGMPATVPVYDATIARPKDKKKITIDSFDPNDLLIQRGWTTPILDDCPYVARLMEVSLSDLKQMGFKATAEELAASDEPNPSENRDERRDRRGVTDDLDMNEVESDDESLTRGWLRVEWVLVDFDGDGTAERREIYRLHDKILSNEECQEVPISTGSPILVPHRWDGMSVAEIISDLQKLKTELTRAVVNNAALANNPRTSVMEDTSGGPMANIDDLLDSRPGGIVRVKRADALGQLGTPFVGNQMFPLLEYVDQMAEKRTGVSKQQQGLDPNALRPDRTAAEVMMTANAAQARIKLIARVMAETVVRPIFRGILRLLTEGDMEPLFFKLRGEYVQLDPNEWHDGFDLTINVGLGTGDEQKKAAFLENIYQKQLQIAASPLGQQMVTPQQIYKTQAKLVALGGFKNVGDFLQDPGPESKLPVPPPAPPDPQVQIAQMKLQAEAQKFQAEQYHDQQKVQSEAQRDLLRQQQELQLQASNDERDAQAKLMEAQYKSQIEAMKLEIERYKIDADNQTRIITARIAHPESEVPEIDEETGELKPKPDPMAPVMEMLNILVAHQQAPKVVLRDENGKIAGIQTARV